MIASLPMYARPSNRAAHDTLWRAIGAGLQERGIAAPAHLDHAVGHVDVWKRSDLVLGHICNLPYRLAFQDRVTRIGASDYGLDDCPAGYYRSVFVVRQTAKGNRPADFAAQRFAYNDIHSQSGFGAAQVWAAQRDFQFNAVLPTGGHWASITAVAQDEADIATIDAQTWRMAQQEHPDAQALRVIGATDPSPGMTFITAGQVDPAPYFAAITQAITVLGPETARVLGLKGIIALPDEAYNLPYPPQYAPPPI